MWKLLGLCISCLVLGITVGLPTKVRITIKHLQFSFFWVHVHFLFVFDLLWIKTNLTHNLWVKQLDLKQTIIVVSNI